MPTRRRWSFRARAILVFLLIATPAVLLTADDFDAWVLSHGQIQILGHPRESRLPVGSLQKPFLVRAWARSHPNGHPPTFNCTSTSGCWRPSGHGPLDLRGAIRESCNTYFKLLARETPQDALRSSFREAGFVWTGDLTEAEAIGLPGRAAISAAPDRLLESYSDLVRAPWRDREDVRQELLSGLKDSANDGTASGVRLWGFMAKTGTVPALDGAPLKTSGFAMVLDDAGFAFLGVLRKGTGREAAIRAGAEIAKLRPGVVPRPPPLDHAPRPRPRSRNTTPPRGLEDSVRVEMLDELHTHDVRLKNLGPGPIDSSLGFVGQGAMVAVSPGDRFSEGTWEIRASKPSFERRVDAALEVTGDGAAIRLIATMTARAYANGILKAELGPAPATLRTQLASTVLRFLSHGPRHDRADVCDSTHCAWFVGEGPVPRWLRPDAAVNDAHMAADLSDDEWTTAVAGARGQPNGSDLWTADCGGDPVSPHFIWGGGDRRVVACPRHPKGQGAVWRREWTVQGLASVFGASPEAIEVATIDGQWRLRVRLGTGPASASPARVLTLSYDDAHRRLATRLGWDAMPAPASRVSRTATGFVAEGVGFGHRVGLCLGR